MLALGVRIAFGAVQSSDSIVRVTTCGLALHNSINQSQHILDLHPTRSKADIRQPNGLGNDGRGTRQSEIMWNRSVLPARRIVGSASLGAEPIMEEPMALEFSICAVRWERIVRTLEPSISPIRNTSHVLSGSSCLQHEVESPPNGGASKKAAAISFRKYKCQGSPSSGFPTGQNRALHGNLIHGG